MPRLTQAVPRYRKHRQSGQAVVTIGGKDHLLGPHLTKASKLRYDALIGEWLLNGRQSMAAAPAAAQGTTAGGSGDEECLTIVECVARFWQHSKKYYRKHGQPTDEQGNIRNAMKFLKDSYGDTLAAQFSPADLKAVRDKMIEHGLARSTINQSVARIRRAFKWFVSEQLVHESVWRALTAVEGLKAGRSAAREPEPVQPVDDRLVDAVLPFLTDVTADMIRVQRATGMRSGELVILRPCDLDRSGDVWWYRPASHKVEHHNRARTVAIGPEAQAVLLRYLARDSQAFCFRPVDSEQKRLAVLHAARVTPLSCGNRPGSNKRRKPRRSPGDRYTAKTYGRAVARACERAFPVPPEVAADPAAAKAWKKEHHWHPHQLRHSCATRAREEFGAESAQHILGHSQLRTAEIYAERSMKLAAKVARKLG